MHEDCREAQRAAARPGLSDALLPPTMKLTTLLRRASRARVSIALLAAFFAGCQTVVETSSPALYTVGTFEVQAGRTPAEARAIAKNCYMGEPTITKSPVKPKLVAREGYVLAHSSMYRGSLWVCEGVPLSQLEGGAVRKDNFRPDTALDPAERSELKDYSGSGYDRGHQAPAADFKRDQVLMDDSFYLSNMSPQIGSGFNRHIWAELEDYARGRIKANGGGYVITGPLFYDPAEDDPRTADGVVKIKWIGGGRVAVPTHFYKIVVLPQGDKATCVAFVLENRKYPIPKKGEKYDFAPFVKTVDWIELRTGIDFMPELDPRAERELEGKPGVP